MRALFVLVLVAVAAAALWFGWNRPGKAEPAPPRAALPERAGFVGSEVCKSCHEDRHETWLATGHAYSLRRADEGAVEGRFDGRPIDGGTFVATPYERDGSFHV